MKKIGFCLIVMLTLVIAITAFGTATSPASQEAVKETAAAAPAAPVETSREAELAREVMDSRFVIPKGPEWIGAPIIPDGKKISEGSGRFITEYEMPYAQVLAWYQEALKKYPHARYRDWKEEMYIEDQGASKWHAIKISKTGGAKTLVTVQKDNWTWIIATLVIRFVGVFVVLLVLWAGLNVSGLIMRRFVKDEAPAAA